MMLPVNPDPTISPELFDTPSNVELPYTLLAEPGVNPNQREINPAFDVLTADGRTVHTSNDWDERNTPGRPFGASSNPSDWTSKANYSKALDGKTQKLVFPGLVSRVMAAPVDMHYRQDNGQAIGAKAEDGKDIDAAPDATRGAVMARFVIDNLHNAGRDTDKIDGEKLAASLEDQGVVLQKSKDKRVRRFGNALETSAQGGHQLFQNRTLSSHNRIMGDPVSDSVIPVAVQHTAQLFSGGWWSEHKRLKAVWAEHGRRKAATELKYLRKTNTHSDDSHRKSYFHKDNRQARIKHKYIREIEHHEHHGEAVTKNLAYGGFDIPLMPGFVPYIPSQYRSLHVDTGAARQLEKRALHLIATQSEDDLNDSGSKKQQTRRHKKSSVKRVSLPKAHSSH